MSLPRYSYLVAIAVLAAACTVRAQDNAKEIMALEPAKLVGLLQKADAPVFEKAKACQRLAVVGTQDAIPALVALLPDEKLNLYARFGLEGIPDPAVDDALRDAATKLQGRAQVGVINSIGQRKDAKAIDLLQGLLGHHEKPVASAAAGALGRIGSPAAAAVLKDAIAKDSPVKLCLGDASLACADALTAAGQQAEAVALYDAVTKANAPKHQQIAAVAGQIRARRAEAKDLVLAQLRAKDIAFFNVGLSAARVVPGADVTAALAAELERLPPERQALLLRALGDRTERAPLPMVIAATKSASPVVREAAVAVLAKIGDASAVSILLDAALGEGSAAERARDGLKNMAAGPETDAAIAAKLAGADAKAKVALFDLAGARRIGAVEPAIRQALTDSDEAVKVAAFGAFGQLADLKDLDLLTSRALVTGKSAEKTAAQAALKTAALRMSNRDACAEVLGAGLKTTTGDDREYVLDLLGKVSGKKALEIVGAAAKSSDAALKDAASKTLGEWVNADAAPVLLDLAKTETDQKFQIRALRGYIRIARQLKLADAAKLEMFNTAMEVAKRPAERQVALDILARIPSVATLKRAASYVDQANLKDAAADAATKIAVKVVGAHPQPVAEAMQKIVDAGVKGKPGAQAKQLLDQAKGSAK